MSNLFATLGHSGMKLVPLMVWRVLLCIFALPMRRVLTDTLFLTGAHVIVLALGFLSKSVQTEHLGPEVFGFYALFVQFNTLAALVFRFGFLSSTKLLLAQSTQKRETAQLLGAGSLIWAVLAILMGLTYFTLSFVVDSWFDVQLGDALRIVAPFAGLVLLRTFIQEMAIGAGMPRLDAGFKVAHTGLYLGLLLLAVQLDRMSLISTMGLQLVSLAAGAGFLVFAFRPSFQNLSLRLSHIRKSAKSYGRHVWFGTTLAQGSFFVDGLCIAAFVNSTELGFYSLAVLLCSPMPTLARSLGQALFKNMAKMSGIPSYVWWVTIGTSLIWCLTVWFGAPWFVDHFFGSSFSVVSTYAMGLLAAHFFQAMYQPMMFLTAHGLGKEVRNVAIIETVVNVLGNLILIYLYGVMGAIITSAIAKGLHFMGLYYYYRRYRQRSAN